jgi:shikimate kinase
MNPRGRIFDLMSARKSYYEGAAEYIIEVDNKSFSEIMKEIREKCQ